MIKFIAFSLLIATVSAISTNEQKLDCSNHEDKIACYVAKFISKVTRAGRTDSNFTLVKGVTYVYNTTKSSKFLIFYLFIFYLNLFIFLLR